MQTDPALAHPEETSSPSPLTPAFALILAAWFGLLGGYLDLGMIYLKRDVFHATLYYEQGRHFRWVVPVANLAVLMVPGLLIAVANRLRPGLVSLRSACLVFATLAIWGPLLRAPFYGAASLVAAVGAARLISRRVSQSPRGFRWVASCGLIVLALLVVTTAAVSLGRQALRESRAIAQRPPAPPAGAPNVLLVVMDTVSADHLGLYGHARDTTPELARWAKQGVRFDWAVAPAPWTFPSHSSFLTGQWPSTLGAHWEPTLNPAYPTLAEFLASRGYLTAGFAANTNWCSYESNMDRGFVHYEDYPLTLATMLRTTMPGRWLLENLRDPRDYYSVKWIRSQSRDAREVNRSFLSWLSHDREREAGRPFFAFLNYLDAHEPFLPPEREVQPSFGLRPGSRADYKMLLEYWDRDKLKLGDREIELARDSYDNCIAALDRQVGALLDELERRELLRNTIVIVTSDHGEEFGEHGVFNHGFSLYAPEVHVPLLILAPGAPRGCTIAEPVSLRSLPATVVDLLGLAGRSPFPGASLADLWRDGPGSGEPRKDRAYSEVDIPQELGPERGRGPRHRSFTISIMDEGLHYLLDIAGTEELYDLASDRKELRDLKSQPGRETVLNRFRDALGEILRDHPAAVGIASAYLKQLRTLISSMYRRAPI
ncbi:MAG: sulfatase-like hydrolase/transferase [Isosphaeraceae bacterium]